MHKSVLALAYEAGLNPFNILSVDVSKSHSVGEIACNVLAGRNPYFDKVNRDRFGTRVHTLELFCSRLVLGAVESAQPAIVGADRRFRSVLFACDGNVLHQTGDERAIDQRAAFVELHYEASKLDERVLLNSLIERRVRGLAKELEKAEKAFAIIHKQGP